MSQIDNLIKMVNESAYKQNQNVYGKSPQIITIASGKGGVGKSNISVNLSLAYGEIGKKVLIIDGDLGLGNVAVFLGLIPKYNLFDVFKRKKNLQEIILTYNNNVSIVPGASGYYQMTNLDRYQQSYLFSSIQQIRDYDVIIIDSGAGLGKSILGFCAISHCVFIVTTQEPAALTDAYGIIKSVVVQTQHRRMGLIVNMVSSQEIGNKVYRKLSSVSEKFLGIKLDLIALLWDDPRLKSAVVNQKPAFEFAPSSRFSNSIKKIAQINLSHLIENQAQDLILVQDLLDNILKDT